MTIRSILIQVCVPLLGAAIPLFGQGSQNCFLEDYYPKYAVIPPYENTDKTTAGPTVTATINAADTLGKVPNYVFGNAVAVWVSQNVNNPTLMGHLQQLSPTLIRFPGGSWSDIYFWSGNPGDLPSQIYDGTTGQKISLNPQFGPGHNPTVDSYYDMRAQLGAQGLITVNYAYARYGLSSKPAERAAHYAAEWVRYDHGRTEFWEIGNENAGPWEAGWRIDHTTSPDGQPDTVTGQLYGKHFKIFADSMRAAAAEVGAVIYIGGIVIHYDGTNSWNVADRKWNEGFFREVGDAADFYVMHNYFGGSASTLKDQVDLARSEIIRNIAFIRQDITNKQAASRPIALTEWNCGGPDLAKTSIANGMQAVVLFSELVKNNVGMSARWLVANWESDGMFYFGNSTTLPRWNPRPDFYYTYYLQRFVGDHSVGASVAGSSDVLAYATCFYSGQAGIVVVNKGTVNQVVKLEPKNLGVGDRFYVYTLTGGTDNSQFPQAVYVNDIGPTSVPWGPLDSLENIRAKAYPIGNEIKFLSPARSVQFVMVDKGDRIISGVEGKVHQTVGQFALRQNYPNPFNPLTTISYSLPRASTVTLLVYDVMGREIATLVRNERESAGDHTISFDAANLPSGVYFYRLSAENFVTSMKMLLIK
jgi:hypothetical protein